MIDICTGTTTVFQVVRLPVVRVLVVWADRHMSSSRMYMHRVYKHVL
jgi:hypothetical protein